MKASTPLALFTALALPSVVLAQEPTPVASGSPGTHGLEAPSGAPVSPSSPTTQTSPSKPTAEGAPNEAEMFQQMMEMAKLNENHKLLGELAGNWDVVTKMMMNPNAPVETKGTAVRKPMMGGRYFITDFKGKMKMPGANGKMEERDFTGQSIEGYDNAKQKFVSTWIDSMGTGILYSEGTYDPASKSFTYQTEMEMVPGMKTKVREVVKVMDKDHHVFEWYETMMSGQEMKTMEIAYSRAK